MSLVRLAATLPLPFRAVLISNLLALQSNRPAWIFYCVINVWNRASDHALRYLYVRWIQDLVESINPSYFDDFDITADSLPPNPHKDRQVIGLDMYVTLLPRKSVQSYVLSAAVEHLAYTLFSRYGPGQNGA